MENKLGIKNRNTALYHKILSEKPEIFNIGDYKSLREKIREDRIKKNMIMDIRNGDTKYLLFTPNYDINHKLYPPTSDRISTTELLYEMENQII